MKQFFTIFFAILAAAGVIEVYNYAKLTIKAAEKLRQAEAVAMKQNCIMNLKMIDAAVQQWALEYKRSSSDEVIISDILPFLPNRSLPLCPQHGVYRVSTVSGSPTCSFAAEGHSI